MKGTMSVQTKAVWLAAVVLSIIITDQVLKIWIKTHFLLYESVPVTSWFELHFIENDGMAFGLKILPKWFLTAFRIIASGAIIYFIVKLLRMPVRFGFIVCVALILAGAAGNMIDCIFYGKIFDTGTVFRPETDGYLSYAGISRLTCEGGGYAPFFYGNVVDMLSFPLFSGKYPEWFPLVGGQDFLFFRYIFNLADAAVTVGVAMILIFYRKELNISLEEKQKSDTNSIENE